jgi:hypothetical protein
MYVKVNWMCTYFVSKAKFLILSNTTYFIPSLLYLLQWHPEDQIFTIITHMGVGNAGRSYSDSYHYL